MAPQFSLFQDHMIASQKWGEDCYALNMRIFDRYCHQNHPTATVLTWDIAMGWCKKRDTENNHSCISRTKVIVRLCAFLNERGLASIQPLDVPHRDDSPKYIPHFFENEELRLFFRACDEIIPYNKSKHNRAHKLMVPIYFRTLYSTGARTKELRLLKREDVRLDEGVISICAGKGYKQRYVAIHESLLPILQKYDAAMEKIYPGRVYFFPSGTNNYLSRQWVTDNFQIMWKKYNTAHTTAYDLRHNYAIVNINAMIDGGYDTFDKLLYLSRSMGHSSVEITRYYYAIVPALGDLLRDQTEASTNEMLRDIDDEEW